MGLPHGSSGFYSAAASGLLAPLAASSSYSTAAGSCDDGSFSAAGSRRPAARDGNASLPATSASPTPVCGTPGRHGRYPALPPGPRQLRAVRQHRMGGKPVVEMANHIDAEMDIKKLVVNRAGEWHRTNQFFIFFL